MANQPARETIAPAEDVLVGEAIAYFAECQDCTPVIMRKFDSFDEREGWIGPHIDITRHRVKSWEEGGSSD